MAPFFQASIQKAASEYLLRVTHLIGGYGSLCSTVGEVGAGTRHSKCSEMSPKIQSCSKLALLEFLATWQLGNSQTGWGSWQLPYSSLDSGAMNQLQFITEPARALLSKQDQSGERKMNQVILTFSFHGTAWLLCGSGECSKVSQSCLLPDPVAG